uniref:Uncharacterized protein n=1 Tax=Kalanchoe fedtschenkoi TaxID=63787 RepID=A0A7N0ZUU2_KALFE
MTQLIFMSYKKTNTDASFFFMNNQNGSSVSPQCTWELMTMKKPRHTRMT